MSSYHHLPILYEDSEILVISKPNNLICHPVGHYQGDSVVSRLQTTFHPIWLTHRLDQGTSGVLIVARTREAVESLNRQFEKRLIKKYYLAIVHGKCLEEMGNISIPLRKDVSPHSIIKIKMEVHLDGMKTQTEFFRLGYNCQHSILLLCPHTGRKHQIRLHLAHFGHPVVGETLYIRAGLPFLWEYYFRSPSPWHENIQGHCLHAYQICFTHPKLQIPMCIRAPIPTFWYAYLEKIGISWQNIESMAQSQIPLVLSKSNEK